MTMTLSSMDTLNLNLTRPFMDIMRVVYAHWRDEYAAASSSLGARRQTFKPYKLVNLTGQVDKLEEFLL